MKILYTIKEGGYLTPAQLLAPDGSEIFAIVFPDGAIWDQMVGVDPIHRICKEEFDMLFFNDDTKEYQDRKLLVSKPR